MCAIANQQSSYLSHVNLPATFALLAANEKLLLSVKFAFIEITLELERNSPGGIHKGSFLVMSYLNSSMLSPAHSSTPPALVA